MTSPLVTLWSTLETTLEALTPPDRTDVTYRHVDGIGTDAGHDRLFWFEPPSEGEPQAERGAALTEYSHRFEIRLRLTADGYSRKTLRDRVANEAVLFLRAIDKAAETSWGSGVLNVITQGYSTERDTKDQVLVTMPVRAFTQETD